MRALWGPRKASEEVSHKLRILFSKPLQRGAGSVFVDVDDQAAGLKVRVVGLVVDLPANAFEEVHYRAEFRLPDCGRRSLLRVPMANLPCQPVAQFLVPLVEHSSDDAQARLFAHVA